MAGHGDKWYSQPRPLQPDINLNGDITIPQIVERRYQRAIVGDVLGERSFNNGRSDTRPFNGVWDAIPIKIVDKTVYDLEEPSNPTWGKALIVPCVLGNNNYYLNNDIFEPFKRTFDTITINRPTINGKPAKAFLHSITYGLYDFNHRLLTTDYTVEELKAQNIAYVKVPDAFGTGYDGIVISWVSGSNMPAPSYSLGRYTSDSAYDVRDLEAIYNGAANNVFPAIIEDRTAPTSGYWRGLLSDWKVNNLKIEIKDDLNDVIFNTHGSTIDEQLQQDPFLPAINNELDILIPATATSLTTYATGGGWVTEIPRNTTGLGEIVVPNNDLPLYTIVQMPVRIQYDLRFEEDI